MTRKMHETELARLAEAIAQGLSCREAAARIGVSAATAIRWTRACGLISRRSRRLRPETRAALAQTLREGAEPKAAAARFGVHPRTAARLVDPRRAAARRQQLVEDVAAGASLREAASRAGVSPATASRWTRAARLPPARLRKAGRRQDEAMAAAAMQGGMSAERAAETFGLDARGVARLARRPPLRPERLKLRQKLFAALATGLSCRKAAAAAGLPVATAIRWARERAPSG